MTGVKPYRSFLKHSSYVSTRRTVALTSRMSQHERCMKQVMIAMRALDSSSVQKVIEKKQKKTPIMFTQLDNNTTVAMATAAFGGTAVKRFWIARQRVSGSHLLPVRKRILTQQRQCDIRELTTLPCSRSRLLCRSGEYEIDILSEYHSGDLGS